MPVLPRGTVSFLFTDIEGSTRLLQQLRDAYADVLGEHRRLLREAFEPVGGLEFGTEGDAVFVVFRRARDAVQAAADAQRMLTAHPWPDGAQLRVRMGIHTGEPEIGPEGYTGLTLHRAARICAAGHGGQVLLSNATRELVEDDLPPETSLRDLGGHRLKDLDRPERIFQLVVEGLQSEFAPVRSLEPEGGRRRRRRPAVIAAVAAAIAAAVAIPVVALSGGSGGSSVEVAPNSVAVIDPKDAKVVDEIGVGARPAAMTSTADALWVGNLEDRSVSRVDLRTRQARTISLGGVPGDLAAGSKAVWAVSGEPRQDFAIVRRIDPAFDRVARTIKVTGSQLGGGFGTVAANDDAVWASAAGFGEVSRIAPDSNRVVATLEPTPAPTSMAVGGGSLWVADAYTGSVTRVDADTGVVMQTIPVGQNPVGLAFGKGALWVAAAADNAVVRIDAAKNVTTTIPVGRLPAGVAIGADAVWVAVSGDGAVAKIDPAARKVVKTIHVGGSPQDVEVAAGLVWVSVQARAPEEALAQRGAAARMASPDRADSLDPAVASGGLQWQIEYATCAKLLNYPDRPGAAGSRLVPEVAASLPAVSADGRTYTFTIRKGFRFSPPSGEPVTARTFAFAIERSLSPRMQRGTAADVVRPQLGDVVGAQAYERGDAKHVAGVVARGNTLTIRLTEPVPDLPERLAQPFFCAVPTDTPIEPIGVRTVPSAGPYYVSEFVLGERIVLKRNPNYGGKRPNRLRQIEIVQGASPQQLAGAASGNVDYATFSAPLEQFARLAGRYGPASPAARRGRQRYFINPQLALDFLILNARGPLFADARLRRAVAYAIDRTALARADISPSVPYDRFLPPGMPGSTPGRIFPDRPDLARARKLSGDRRGTAVFYTCNLLPCAQLAQIVKQNLAPIGIDVSIEQLPIGRYLSVLGRRKAPFDIAFFGHNADSTDPGAYLAGLGLFTYLDSSAYERKFRAASRLSGARRERAFAQLQAELTRDAAPLAIIGVNVRQDFFSARMGCQVYNPLYGMDLAALCVRR